MVTLSRTCVALKNTALENFDLFTPLQTLWLVNFSNTNIHMETSQYLEGCQNECLCYICCANKCMQNTTCCFQYLFKSACQICLYISNRMWREIMETFSNIDYHNSWQELEAIDLDMFVIFFLNQLLYFCVIILG